MKTPFFILMSFSGLGLLAGCSSGSTVVDRNQVGMMQRIELGTVQSVQFVTIEGETTPVGMYGGAAVGAASMTGVGGAGAGTNLARAGGGIVGAVAGRAIEKAVTRKAGEMITVKLDSGQTVVVTQEQGQLPFATGERVRVLAGGKSKVERL